MLKIAVCDDNAVQLDQIERGVKQYFSAHPECDIQISVFTASLLLLEQLDKTDGWDIALLDICMPGISGTGVAREIRQRGDKTEIVFLTTSDEFAVDAFALKAAHYLLKPFTQAQLGEALDRAMTRLCEGGKRLAIKTAGGKIFQLDINEILYIESSAHSQTVRLKDGTVTEANRFLARLQEELELICPGRFVSPFKGYLLNLAAVRSIGKESVTMKNGEAIPLAKRGFRAMRDRFLDYTFGEDKT